MRQRRPKGQPKKTCSKCGEQLEETRQGKYRYCRKCHAEYMRKTRPKHSELSKKERDRSTARRMANAAVKKGQIKKKPCERCGAVKSEKHHDDYSKPLEVIWLCRPCHIEHHKKMKESKDLGNLG